MNEVTKLTLKRLNDDIVVSQDQQEQLLQLQRDILESIAINNNHTENLNLLCHAAEAILPNAVASVMLFDETRKHLNVRAALSLSQQAITQLNGLVPGPNAGSCAAAMYYQKPIFVADTSTDPRWADVTQYTIDFNICACWSMPIKSPNNLIVGSFALSSYEKRAPNDFQQKLLSIGANLAALILQRENMEKKLWNMAHYDPLTLLPNRILLQQKLNTALLNAKNKQQKIALLFIDLDNFKNINDNYGHLIGDKVLITVANAMQQCIREHDTLSRTGGDEFVLLVENTLEPDDIAKVADKILTTLSLLPPIEGTTTSLTTSIGISLYPDDANDSMELMRNADTAMYESKKTGRNKYSFYHTSLTEKIRHQLEIESEIKIALLNDEFQVYYQPQFSAENSTIVAAEALIRWQHPNRGLLMPIDFIPIAEKSNLINDIGLWVLKNTCIQGKNWLRQGINFKRIAVNVSIRQLVPEFSQDIFDILAKTDFPAKKLELEITESQVMEAGYIAITELDILQKQGISIALDDFGTGYSSLHQIHQLPLNKLKIDRNFVTELPDNKDDVILAKMIIAMAKALSLVVTAEGVETTEQQQFLYHEGCDLLQGFLLGKPMPASELERLMKTN